MLDEIVAVGVIAGVGDPVDPVDPVDPQPITGPDAAAVLSSFDASIGDGDVVRDFGGGTVRTLFGIADTTGLDASVLLI